MWYLNDIPIAPRASCFGCKYRKDMVGGECKMYLYMDELACIEGKKEERDESVQSDGRVREPV